MEITIKNNNAYQSLVEQTKIKWAIYSKKTNRAIFIFYVVGIVIFLMGMYDKDEYSTSSSGYSEGKYALKYITYSNWHLMETFGLVTIILTTYFVYLINVIGRNKFFLNNELRARKLAPPNNEIIIKATDSQLVYQTDALTQCINWNLFYGHSYFQNHIVLNIDDAFNNTILIDKSLLSETEFDELFSFIKKTVPSTDKKAPKI
jgi:hypothetical protein